MGFFDDFKEDLTQSGSKEKDAEPDFNLESLLEPGLDTGSLAELVPDTGPLPDMEFSPEPVDGFSFDAAPVPDQQMELEMDSTALGDETDRYIHKDLNEEEVERMLSEIMPPKTDPEPEYVEDETENTMMPEVEEVPRAKKTEEKPIEVEAMPEFDVNVPLDVPVDAPVDMPVETIEDIQIPIEDNYKEDDNGMDESIEVSVDEAVGDMDMGDTGVMDFDDSPVTDETGLITTGMTLTGDLSSNGSLDILGTVNGNIAVKGKLNISGTVEGNSKAAEIFADSAKITGEVVSTGAVKGDIDVHGPVILDTSAIVMGDIKSKTVQINNGAVIEGHCSQCYADVSPTSFFEELKSAVGKNKKAS